MRYTFTIFTFLIFINSVFPQNQDSTSFNDLIKTKVMDSSSIYYYPNLLRKIKQKPSEIKISEIYYLYYGRIFQSDYHFISLTDDQIAFRKAIMNGNRTKAIKLGTKVILNSPMDLTTLLHLSICMKEENILDTINYVDLRYRLLLDAILSTGNGKCKESAIKVINIDDESVIKGAIGFLGGKTYLTGGNNHAYDVWEVEGKKLYFELIIEVKQ
jgi:hypothetical protein